MGQNLSLSEKFADTSGATLAPQDAHNLMILGIIWALSCYGIGMIWCAAQRPFLPTDPLVAQGQQEALNPNTITNRICDQLTNVCGANDAAKALCEQAKAQVQALGTKDATTADAFNAALGF
ncbi:hypothetical protein VTK26DRAFT_1941 [Humicola hyalothermophila]